jgi:catechol 2,3-dioxygenase-like lactoylglutathione lyase family enzyme
MTDSEPTIRPPRAQLTHLGLYVEDMEAMVAFYCQLLGMVVTDRGELFERELAFLSRDPTEHHQIVLVTGRKTHDDVQLLSQISFRLDDDDLASLRWFARRATDLGATAMDVRNHGNSWSIYFLDPESNRLELYTTTPWYVSQPWREPLDLSDSDEVIRSTTKSMIEATATWSPVEEWTTALASRLSR